MGDVCQQLEQGQGLVSVAPRVETVPVGKVQVLCLQKLLGRLEAEWPWDWLVAVDLSACGILCGQALVRGGPARRGC